MRFIRGDASGDNRVDQTDTVVILGYVNGTGRAPTCKDAADVDDDGSVTVFDATRLQGYLFASTYPAPVAPYPQAGVDATADDLGCSGPALPTTQVPSPAPARGSFVRGDANGDGRVDIADIIATTNYLSLGYALACLDAADANDDGQLTLTDAATLDGYLFKGTHPAPAAPFPRAGLDATPDDLDCSGVPASLPPAVARAVPTASASPSVSPTPQPSPQAAASPIPAITPAPLPTPAASPTPTPTVAPTPAPRNLVDSDFDGLSDALEAALRSNPKDSDTDGDGYLDGFEVRNRYSPTGGKQLAVTTYGLPKLERRQMNTVINQLRQEVSKINQGSLPRALRSRSNAERAAQAYLAGYTVQEIRDAAVLGIKRAPAVHPSINPEAWRKSPEYARYQASVVTPASGGGSGEAATLWFRRGDANADGRVDVSDLSKLGQLYLQSTTFSCQDAADLNDDGRIDQSDMVYFSGWFFSGMYPDPPAPGPTTMGPDPTPDRLGCESYPNQPAPPTLTVALSPRTPPAGVVSGGAQRVPFTMFTLTAAEADVVVDSITIERRGGASSTDEIFASVELFDTNTSSPVLPRVFFSLDQDHRVVYTDPFVVSAGTSRDLMISATLRPDVSGHAGERVAFAVAAVRLHRLSGNARLVAQLPIVGNPQTIVLAPPEVGVVPVSTDIRRSLLPGAQNAVVAGFQVINRWLAYTEREPLVLRQVNFRYVGTVPAGYLSNPRLVHLQTGQVLGAVPSISHDQLSFAIEPLTIQAGEGPILELMVNFSVQAQAGQTIAWTIDRAEDVILVDPRGRQIVPEYFDSTGQPVVASPFYRSPEIQVTGASGSLTVAALTQNHPAGLLPANTNGLAVGMFRFTSTQEPVRVEKIYLSADSTRKVETHFGRRVSAFNQVRAVHLYDGATLLATVQPTSTDQLGRATVLIDLTANPIVVSNIAAKDITVKVDTNAVTRYPRPSTGDPGQGFIFSIAAGSDVVAKGAQSATLLTGADITLSGATLNPYTVWNTVPVVTVHGDLPPAERIGAGATLPRLAAGSQQELYRFKVAADSAGDVYLQQVTFMLDQQRATVTNPLIVRADTAAQVAATSTSPLALMVSPGRLAQNFAFWFTSDGLRPTPTTVEPQRIPAGSARLYRLKGDVVCWRDNGCGTTNGVGTVAVSFLGDGAFPVGSNVGPAYPNSSVRLYHPGANVNRFVWSDGSITGPLGMASTTATTAEQWTNGFRVSSGASSIARLMATTTDVHFDYP